MHKIKAICVDLDGTLFRKHGMISEKDRQALIACCEQGILVYLVTGRPYCYTKLIASSIHPSIQVVSANGAIYELDGQCIERRIPNELIECIVSILQKETIHSFFKGKHIFYTHDSYDPRFLYDHLNDQLPNTLQVVSHTELSWELLKQEASDIVKVLVYSNDPQALSNARQQLQVLDCLSITDYQEISFDINAKDVNKGTALTSIQDYYHLSKDSIMAIGDGHNDLPMFQAVGLKIAMGNACEEIQQACDDVTNDHLHDGVANAIYKYVNTL